MLDAAPDIHAIRETVELLDELPGVGFTGLTCDSQKVEHGFLFAALPGVRADGRAFIPEAIAKGAAAVLAPPGTPSPPGGSAVPVVETDAPRRRYALLAARFFHAQPQTIAGVTGTNGKTSTASFLRQIWTHAGRTAASMGTLGVQSPAFNTDKGLTTPDAADLHRDLERLAVGGVTDLALEASSHGLDQNRLDGVTFTAAAFTNLTRDHLDYHPSMDAYFEAKARLFTELLGETGTAVVNMDDAHGRTLRDRLSGAPLKVLEVGQSGRDIRLISRRPLSGGQELILFTGGRSYQLTLPLVGAFQAENALAALGLALATGVDADKAAEALSDVKGAPGRLELAGATNKGATVFVDYAHTPDALNNVLTALRPHTENRLHVIFGCGGNRDPGKRKPMGEACRKLADMVILTDDNPRDENPASIRREARKGAPGALEIGDRRRAIETAIADLEAGDVLVITGKGHEQGQIVGGQILPFDDLTEARKAIAAGTKDG